MKLIGDSCLDLTPELKERLEITQVPLTISLKDISHLDDENLDLPQLLEDIRNCDEKVITAAPSPALFREAFEGDDEVFVVTLSSNLSGSYQSAMIAKNDFEEEGKGKVHVFNSKSASAGEILTALKIRELINNNETMKNIISTVEDFISNLKTYFVLDDISTLVKNGRLNKIVGTIITTLGIKPLMGTDKEGNIMLAGHSRSETQTIKKMLEFVTKSGKDTANRLMVITHCNNLSLAKRIMEVAIEKFNFAEILIVPTGGLSSVYANEGGVIMAF